MPGGVGSPGYDRSLMRFLLALLVVGVVSSVSAADGIRDGANHHLGDDSFIAAYGRLPGAADSETLRMHVHLAYVKGLLAARAATSPALAGRRAELLGYLDDYIAAGTTPQNTYVPWRSPVFIDADGRICAVGYLIERSVGRALPELVAATHRLAYLEDIAAAMPQVGAWVASSGFTLEELASIQPGYMGPEVQHRNGWGKDAQPDGAYHETIAGISMDGAFKRRQMVGVWKRTSETGVLLGTGTFKKGSGTWKSLRADGSVMAQGPFANSHATGSWKFFHPSGRLAATGPMGKGKRDGVWTFFYDEKAKVKLASGRFADGEVVGDWQHFDATGKLVATAIGHAWSDDGLTLVIRPGADRVRHEITQGEPANDRRLDAFYLGNEKLFVADDGAMYDGIGNKLEQQGDAWTARTCTWSAKKKRAAAAGNTGRLYHLIGRERWDSAGEPKPEECAATATAVPAKRAAKLTTMLASRKVLHAPIPVWTIAPRPDADADADAAPPAGEDPGPAIADNPLDMTTMLADHMTWYMEWPHIDGTFVAVYETVPGYTTTPNY